MTTVDPPSQGVEQGPVSDPWDLSMPLLQLSELDVWTVGNSFEGTQILGSVGSGKTSGSGATIAKAMLRAGYGGLVLTAKGDEPDLWRRYCEETGRSDSLIMFGPDHDHGFNFLDYEARRPTGGVTQNIADLLMSVQRESARSQGAKEELYWRNMMQLLLENTIELLRLAGETLSVPAIDRLIQSAPLSPEQIDDEDSTWHDQSFCADCLRRARDRVADLPRGHPDRLTLSNIAFYWLEKFPTAPDKGRGSVLTMIDALVNGFLSGPMRSLFCERTTVIPELSMEGAVIVLDLPIKRYQAFGRAVQILWKMMWQRAVEDRNIRQNPRPVFFWADEAHNFYTAGDQNFQTTARSSRVASVLLTQMITNYHAMMGGESLGDAKATTDAYLGTLQTFVFHANADTVTNQWAIDYFAKQWRRRMSRQTAEDKEDGRTLSEQLDPMVLAKHFQTLKRGGTDNGLVVEALISRGAQEWKATGTPQMKIAFKQG